MLSTSCIAVLISLQLVSQAPEKSASWVVVQSQEGGFTFSMPSKPIEQTADIKSPAGPLKAKIYFSSIRGDGFIVQQLKLPGPVPPNMIASQLEAAKKVMPANMPRPVAEKPIKLGEVPGLELVLSGPAGPDGRKRNAKIRMFIKESSMCVFMVAGGPDQPLPPDAERFFDSIRFGGESAVVARPKMAAKPTAAAPPAMRKPLAKIDLVDKTPEDAYRTFMMAMIAADEPTLRAVTLENRDLAVLLTGEAPPFAGVKELKQRMQKLKIQRLKVGDPVRLPGNKVHVTRVTEVGQDRAVLLPEDTPVPTRLRLVAGHWKVDAAPVIAARKAADAARK